MENQQSLKNESSLLCSNDEEIMAFLDLKKKDRLESINLTLTETFLNIFQIRPTLQISDFPNIKITEIYNSLTRVEYKQFQERELITDQHQSYAYVLQRGDIYRLKQKNSALEAHSRNMNQFKAKQKENDKKSKGSIDIYSIIFDQQAVKIYAKTNCKMFRMEKWNYFQLAETIKNTEEEIILKHLSNVLKIESQKLKEFEIIKKVELVKIASNKALQMESDCLYLLKSGSIEYIYGWTLNGKLKRLQIVLNEGCFLSTPNHLKCAAKTLCQSLVLVINAKNLNSMYQQFQHLKHYLIHLHAHLHQTRIKILSKGISKCKTVPADEDLILKQRNMKIDGRRKSQKRFRKSEYLFESDKNHMDYKGFISNLPYQKLIESEEYIKKKKQLRELQEKKSEKIMSYLKKTQLQKKNKDDKILRLKMKNMAEKSLEHQPKSFQHKANQPKKKDSLRSNLVERVFSEYLPDDEELFLAHNDTGIINSFIKNSHNYQKEISYLLDSNQLENKGRALDRTDSGGNIFCHQMLVDMMKDYGDSNCKENANKYKYSHKKTDGSRKELSFASTCYNNFIDDHSSYNQSTSKLEKKNMKRPVFKRLVSGKVIKATS